MGGRTSVSLEVEAIHQSTMKRGSVLSGAGQASALLPGVPSHGSVLGKRPEKVIDMWVLVYPISKELLSMNTPAHHTCPDEGMMAKRSRLKMIKDTIPPALPPKKTKNHKCILSKQPMLSRESHGLVGSNTFLRNQETIPHLFFNMPFLNSSKNFIFNLSSEHSKIKFLSTAHPSKALLGLFSQVN